ncbi:MAG TPA: hypothetical protein VFZ09_40025 [Archangium sp.]|uniref:hypothetical protein n=1 Tax=Archangium sp. TaxID=1872627 RepID=UPI002E32A0DE|nr:hypothetical protein [Archangium sp.]HEX5752462.1 hypothetical protein [Archangium sp.]
MPLSAESLLSVVRNYWRSDHEFDGRLERSPETERFQDLWEERLERMGEWHMLLDELQAALPRFLIGNATATCDACFRCSVYMEREPLHSNQGNEQLTRRQVVVGCVSILAPVYTVYGAQYDYRGKERIADRAFFEPLPPEMRALAEIVARKIEARFGVEAVPREIAETRIPLIVGPREPPETTLFHALFTAWPESVP